MEQNRNPDSPAPKRLRAPHGSRQGKKIKASAEPPTSQDTRKKRRAAPQARRLKQPSGGSPTKARRLKQPSGGSPTKARARGGVSREDIAPADAGAENRKLPETPSPAGNTNLPSFDLVPMKPRHDGWTPERQRAFIGALADTGSVTRACRYVNMSTTNAYALRRHVGAEGFRRAWEAALDLGVQRLKDELHERALEGQLSPVFIGGKLKGFRRVKNDRLLMFALRMNAKDERGKRLSASYFDPGAARLHGGSGFSDGGERSKLLSPSPLAGEGLRRGGSGATRLGASLTIPAPTRAEKDDMNAGLVEHFDPVAMTLPEIEAMQAMLVEAAARRRAEEAGPPEQDSTLAFIANRDGEFKPVGPLEHLEELTDVEDELEDWNPEEDHWRDLE